MKFVDYIEIKVKSGSGGPGAISFRSAKNKPKMGADGGDGGRGGSVYFVGNRGMNTFGSLFPKKTYKAQDGHPGGSNDKTGKNGADLFIPVPCGTSISDLDTGEIIGEVLDDGGQCLIASGGERGIGNRKFLSSTHQAPQENTSGGAGALLNLGLELKLIADVGLCGFPNAGKSMLLRTISSARPKVANYPFTTLIPHLGVVDVSDDDFDEKTFVVADIPGLIEGASEGRGLGHDFLKHLMRTKVIAYVIDGFSDERADPIKVLKELQSELESYDKKLREKPFLVIITKSDLKSDDSSETEWMSALKNLTENIAVVSSQDSHGIEELKGKLFKQVQRAINKCTKKTFSIPQDSYEFDVYQSAPINTELDI